MLSDIPAPVVPWAAAFVGSIATSWLVYNLFPKKYRDFLASLGFVGGGALGYYLAKQFLGGDDTSAGGDNPAEDTPTVSTEQEASTDTTTAPSSTPTTADTTPVATTPIVYPEQQAPATPPVSPGTTETPEAPTSPQDEEATPEPAPGFWARNWARAGQEIDKYPSTPKPFSNAFSSGVGVGLMEAYQDAVDETADNQLLHGWPSKALEAGLEYQQLEWLKPLRHVPRLASKIPLINRIPMGWARKIMPWGVVGNFLPSKGFDKGMGLVQRSIDATQVAANTLADARKGLSDRYYADKADQYVEDVLDDTGWSNSQKATHMLGKQIGEKALHTLGTYAIAKSPHGAFGLTQLGVPAPHIPVGEFVGLTRDISNSDRNGLPRLILPEAVKQENRMRAHILNKALFSNYKEKPGESKTAELWRNAKNIAVGTGKLFSGGIFGKDIYNTKTEEEAMTAKPLKVADVKHQRDRLTRQVLEDNPDIAFMYHSKDPLARQRARQQINKLTAPALNAHFTF